MKWAVLSALALLLSGCIADQKQQLASCTLDAVRHNPGDADSFTPAAAHLESVIDNDILLCMKAHGYVGDIKDDDCRGEISSPSFAKQDYCYLPDSAFGRAEFHVERWLETAGR